MPLKRIKYVSRYARHLTENEIESIVATSQRNNAARQISGIMATSGRMFYQVLEGPSEAVDALYARISADPRHTDVALLRNQEDVAERLFARWSMRQINLEELASLRMEPLREMLSTVVDLRERSDRMAAVIERALANEVGFL